VNSRIWGTCAKHCICVEKINFIELDDVMAFFEMLKWFPKLSERAEIEFVLRK
jgi:hypothetical protein